MVTINLFLIIILIIVNAFFAGSEAALVAANEVKVKSDVEKKKKGAKLTLKYINDSTNFLSTIQVGITFIGFVNGFLAAEAFTEPILALMGQSYVDSTLWQSIVKIVITIILTYAQVVFGELVPKKIAIQNPERFIYLTVGILNFINKVLQPLVWLFTKSANLVAKMLGIKEQKEQLTEDEIRMLVVGSGNAIKESEKEMFENLLDFDDQLTNDVMTHRTEVAGIDIKMTRDQVINIIKEEQFTRFPVYRESIDDIIGILNVKDLLIYLAESKSEFNLNKLLRKPLYVPDSKRISDLFKEMQKSNQHIAVVLDEYGGTAGIITIEDILEELVGNIFDEYDDVLEEVLEIAPNEYKIDALADIDDIENIIDADLPIDDYDTLSGFILGHLGRFPEDDELIEFIYKDFKYEVLEYEDKVIRFVKATRLINEETLEEEDLSDE